MTDTIRILIAEDHPIVREGLATVLNEERDLEVVGEASNGIEAVSQARELHPDIILMDIQMPEMDGVTAIRKIKKDAPDIGIIILTTYDDDDDIFSGIQAGARAYLLKATPRTEVIRAIRAIHAGVSLTQPMLARRLVDRLSKFLSRHSTRFGRISLATVFVWFGLLKVIGESPVAELVADMAPWLPALFVVSVLGITEIILGLGLVFDRTVRIAILLLCGHLVGATLSVLVLRPDLAFQGGNPLLLTLEGEFVIKNLVLVAAGLVMLYVLRQPRDMSTNRLPSLGRNWFPFRHISRAELQRRLQDGSESDSPASLDR